LNILNSSFRDPSGFVFEYNGEIYRQVNRSYKEHYEMLIQSGLYQSLVNSHYLIAHEEAEVPAPDAEAAWKVIKPTNLSMISYPYEWSFNQLKDAALLTLEIQKQSLDFGMSLKDATAYNVQFHAGKPVFIDTLSFEPYEAGSPWIAYRQFVQHFYAPLLLMCYVDIRLNQLFKTNIDGIPLDLASALLPKRTYTRFSILSHIHLHAKSQKYYGDKKIDVAKNPRLNKHSMLALIDNLESSIRKLRWKAEGTEWGNYYDATNYTPVAAEHKEQILREYVAQTGAHSLWDIGANTGFYSRIASDSGIETVSFDIDPAAVDKNYLQLKKQGDTNLLPLLSDITNPSPSIGWGNRERLSLFERGKPDAVMALALIHHLVIGANVPLEKVASLLAELCNSLIIEFVPKTDSQVQRLLANREDIFTSYHQEYFEKVFNQHFNVMSSIKINDSERTMYLFSK
jgi:ribosomal protein L11 methylase PrmA